MGGCLLSAQLPSKEVPRPLTVTRSWLNPMEKSIYTKDYATFLACLRQTRRAAGLTQQDISEKLCTTQSVISKCERGERRIDVVELREFCKAMGISLREFIEALESAIESNGELSGQHATS